jgi:hypothetical protein
MTFMTRRKKRRWRSHSWTLCRRLSMEEDARLLMEATGEKINELNKQTHSI